MNFLFNFVKSRIIFFQVFFLIQCLSFALFAQYQELGLSYTLQVRPINPTGINQFHSIAQDLKGFLYIGGYNGVLRYDGHFWEKILIPGEISIASDSDGKIFAGGDQTFGIISYLQDGSMHFNDLLTTCKNDTTEFGKVRKIIPSGDYLLIHTTTNVYIFHNGIIQPLDLPEIPRYIVPSNDKMYLYLKNHGLYLMTNGQILHLAVSEYFSGLTVTGIIQSGDSLLIHTSEKGFQKYYDGYSERYQTPFDSFIDEHGYFDGISCNDGSLIITTENSGLVTWDPKQNITQYFNIANGLSDSRINSLYSDRSGNIWVVHDESLTRIEWPSPFSYFDNKNGLSGNIRSVIRHKGEIYTSSSQGIYKLIPPLSPDHLTQHATFHKLEDTDYDCGSLLSTGDHLLAPCNSGIVCIVDNKGKLIFPEQVNVLYQSHLHPGIILAGTSTGLLTLSHSNNKWTITPISTSLNDPVTNIAESDQGYLWLSTMFNGIFRISFSDGYQAEMEYSHYGTADGLSSDNQPVEFTNANNKLIFSTPTGLYWHNHTENRFISYNALDLPGQKATTNMILLIEDQKKNLWIKTFDPELNKIQIWKAAFLGPDHYELSQIYIDRLNKRFIQSIYTEPDNIVWICCNDLLIRADPSYQNRKIHDFQTHISKITLDNEIIICPQPYTFHEEDEPSQKLTRIPFSKNNIQFNFVSIDLASTEKELYQWVLHGLDDQWSEWTATNHLSFYDLPFGKYTFRVRSMDEGGFVSAADQFSFRIVAPLYFAWWAIILYIICILLGVYFYQKLKIYRNLQERYRLEEIVKERTEALIKEKEKSENLLANILPKSTADELKLTGKATSSKFKMATVLFADIQGFTKIAEQMNPDKLIDELDRFYFHFDSVVEKYNIEKIKTIGDAYMAAGGIPIKNRTNPVEVVLAALQMQHYMKELKKTKADIWDLRIGIHTGSVIAGVVGQKKYSYDIWGDTVNTASRMESSGEVGKVNISATTHKLVSEFFDCQYRGKMPVKYKGDIEMYFVKGIQSELQAENEITPNEEFEIRLQLLRLLDLEEFILQKLEKELPETLYFHNAAHTSHVYTQAELLGRSENVARRDLLVLRTAALLHDIGYIDNVEEHEKRSVELAYEILKAYQYNEEQIEQINRIIMATKIPPEPENLNEQIICDANLDHLGRVDFLVQSDKLFQEYRTLNKVKSKKEWNEFQADFLRNHEFFTNAAKRLREVSKEDQILNIMQYS